MNKPLLLPFLSLVTLAVATSSAHAQHDVRVFLAESGVELVEEAAPSFVPSVIEPPTFAKSFGCMDFEQRNTVVNISLDDLDIDMPDETRIRVALDFSLAVNGELYADDLYACLGEVTCQDSLTVDRGSALIDFDLYIVGGQPAVATRNVVLDLSPDSVDFSLDGCGMTGSALTTAVNFAEGWILSFAEAKVASIASENLAPMLESVLSGLSMNNGKASASIEDLFFPNEGMSLTIDAGIADGQEAHACIAEYDNGGPERETGAPVPDLQGDDASDLNLAVNLGLLNDGMYTAWRRGLMCLTESSLENLGLVLDFDHIGALLPGFPPGTEFGLDLRFTDYPRVKGGVVDGASTTVVISGLELNLRGDRPDGTTNTLHAELDVEATAKIVVNPASNAINVQLVGAEIKHMIVEDERTATEQGYDVARIKQLVHKAILPTVLGDLGPIPVTGSVFSVSDFAVILRKLDTNRAYLSAGVDLFQIPENDGNAPETLVTAPAGVLNPHTAVVHLSGIDGEIPSELLQYQVAIDGVESELSFITDVKVGEVGRSGSYEVRVAAVDLSGNVDSTPDTKTLTVDGIIPTVIVKGSRTRSADEGPVEIAWDMSDDLSVQETLSVRVEIYDVEDPSDVLSARRIDTLELPVGTTSTVVELDKVGGVYRVEVHVVDEAGNDAQASLILGIASAGGCSAGGTGGNGVMLLMLGLALLALRRGCRQSVR